jgi:hypothetical protein
MPRRKPDDTRDESKDGSSSVSQTIPPEAYQYEAELKVEMVKLIQARADKLLSEEEWVVIDGVNKR